MRRNRFLAGALAAALAAACRRAPSPAASDAPALPPGVTLSTPLPTGGGLGAETTGYTNEMQAQNLREQAAELGIRRLAKPSEQPGEPEENRAPITYEEGLARTREYAREFAAQRRAIDKDKPKSVQLTGGTPGMLPGKKEGAPVEPASDAAGPKGPEEK